MKDKIIFYVGSYTKMSWCKGSPGEGLYRLELDRYTGQMKCVGVTKGLINPSYAVIDTTGSHLYTINEVQPVNEEAIGRISSFEIDQKTKELTLIGEISSFGLSPCYILLDYLEKYSLITNFCSAGIAVFELDQHQSISKLTHTFFHTGNSVNADRQEAPHPHSLGFDKQHRHIIVPDLGLDKLIVYRSKYIDSELKIEYSGETSVDPGMGPRHFIFNSSGNYLYLICEMGSRIYVFDYHPDTGFLAFKQSISTLPADCNVENSGAHIAISNDDRYLYASNRGHNSIAVYQILSDGTLKFQETVSTGGETPRHFALDLENEFLIVANHDSDLITCFQRDRETGHLSSVAELKIPSPVNVTFFNCDR